MMLSSVPAVPRGGQQIPGTISVGLVDPLPPLSQLYHEKLATGCRETSKDQKTAAACVGPLMTMSLRPAESKARDGNLGMSSGGRPQQIPVEHRQNALGSVSSLRGHVYGTAGSADFRRAERPVSDQVWNVCLVLSVCLCFCMCVLCKLVCCHFQVQGFQRPGNNGNVLVNPKQLGNVPLLISVYCIETAVMTLHSTDIK